MTDHSNGDIRLSMESFIRETARDLYGRYGDGISSLRMLFPSRRAQLFFTDALADIAQRPLWQPRRTTVDQLMEEVSGLHTADRLRLIAELYNIYSDYHHEPFDKFYFWGDMLLNDFDTVDKYMVDARMLFRNISDIKEIESDLSYLTPQQLRTVQTFWGCFGDRTDLSNEKRRFLDMWRSLYDIYERFRTRLAEQGIAYVGMMHRTAAEMLRDGRGALPEGERYAVVGFNALSECEKQLFRSIEAGGQADFYWDYDSYYCDRTEQEAGMFLRDNIRMFPPRVGTGVTHDSMTTVPKRFTSVAVPSNAVQCKYLPTILRTLAERNGGRPLDKETAIVLTDESLLMTVLHSLPARTCANVTMGYPLHRTPAYSLVERLIELQSRRRMKESEPTFWHADVSGLLSHPYIAEYEPQVMRSIADEMMRNRTIRLTASTLGRNELLRTIFRAADDGAGLADYLVGVLTAVARLPYEGDDAARRTEFLAVAAEEISKTRNSLVGCGVGDITTQVCISLLRKHLRTLRIPFDGEPLEGIQIMGILETRNLDFKNVIVMSMTDDNFPGSMSSQSSFVPYNLRAAYSLPTPEHHEGVYAYYFYRLIQRAENVYMCYCSHADDKTTGEPSRYIRQLEFESGFTIEHTEVGFDVTAAAERAAEVPKDERIAERLMRLVADDNPSYLSPTAFCRYVACPMKFYFASVACLKAEDEISDEVDARAFGNILHSAVQTLYELIRNQQHPAAALRAMAGGGEIERAVEQAIREKWLKDETAVRDDYSGNLTLVSEIVARYIRDGIMRHDAANDGFAVMGIEETVESEFEFEAGGSGGSGGRRLKMHFRGISDRIDSLDDGSLRVTDYKTGTPHLDFDCVESLFRGKAAERQPHIIQTLLYSMMLHRSRGRDVVPSLYYVQQMASPAYSPRIICKKPQPSQVRYSDLAAEFESEVRGVLAEMYDMSVPFRRCDDRDTCKYCDYKRICNR